MQYQHSPVARFPTVFPFFFLAPCEYFSPAGRCSVLLDSVGSGRSGCAGNDSPVWVKQSRAEKTQEFSTTAVSVMLLKGGGLQHRDCWLRLKNRLLPFLRKRTKEREKKVQRGCLSRDVGCRCGGLQRTPRSRSRRSPFAWILLLFTFFSLLLVWAPGKVRMNSLPDVAGGFQRMNWQDPHQMVSEQPELQHGGRNRTATQVHRQQWSCTFSTEGGGVCEVYSWQKPGLSGRGQSKGEGPDL